MNLNRSDLRVGNLIHQNNSVIKVLHNDLLLVEIRPEDYVPIKLDKSWLKRLGFVSSLGENWWVEIEDEETIHTMCVRYLKDRIVFWVPYGTDGEFVEVCDVEYVHQLQNLFFTINGKELEWAL